MGKLDVNDWSFLSLHNEQPAADIKRQADSLITERHREMGLSYQGMAYGLVRTLRTLNPVVVETGVYSGLSTYFLLQALGQRPDSGMLVSVDPMYKSKGDATGRVGAVEYKPFWKDNHHLFNKWDFFSGKSNGVFDDIAKKYPEWDIFIHDSDHSAENVRFELEYAWKRLKPGGFMLIDDPRGVDHTGFHNEAEKFLDKYNLDWALLASTIIVRKPIEGEAVKTIISLTELTENAPPPAPPEKPLTEEEELAQREAELERQLAANPPPPLPGVTPAETGKVEEVFEQPEENALDSDDNPENGEHDGEGSMDDLDAIIGGESGDGASDDKSLDELEGDAEDDDSKGA